MTEENTKKSNISIYIAVIWMLIGFISISGSLMAKNIAENELGNLFNTITTPIIFAIIPLLFLKHIRKINIKNWIFFSVTTLMFLLVCISQFGQTYNYFVQIDDNLNRDIDNIAVVYQNKLAVLPSITTSINSYNEHERGVIKDITDGRRKISTAQTSSEKIEALSALDYLSKDLSINIENYPDLKSVALVKEFIQAMKNIEGEAKSMKIRYNNEVSSYNNNLKIFPYVFIARSMEIKPKEYFTSLKNKS